MRVKDYLRRIPAFTLHFVHHLHDINHRFGVRPGVGCVKIQEIYRGVIPFILIIIAVVILVTVFPQVVYFLPNLVAS